ncbi:MAG: DUF2334 domain-containing protein [Lachnospiraceae bacterium]|nr:DUF2334 domain-containing protein [Lachnospiraceae bacterium]
MKIAVRLDDITPDMDWEGFLRFKALLDRYQVKPLIGVIPQNRDENVKGSGNGRPGDFWAYIRKLQEEGWVVAMHGYEHVYTTQRGGLFPLNHFSEFAGLPYEKQRQMLEDGKKLLEDKGVFTDLFMAPAHSYDRNTLKALKDTGFKGITDGFGDFPYVYRGLTFYPISFRFSATLKKKKGYSTMVVHTGTNTEKEMEQYEGYFQRGDVTWISYGEYLNAKAAKRGILGRCREFLMAAGKFWLVKLKSV